MRNFIAIAGILYLLSVASIASPALAGEQHVIGIVASISADQITVKATGEKMITVTLAVATRFVLHKTAVPASELQIGDRVVIRGRATAGGNLTADVIEFATTAASVPATPSSAAPTPTLPKVTLKYDRFTDTTSIGIQGSLQSGPTVDGRPFPIVRGIGMNASIACIGDVRSCPADKIAVTFMASTLEWQFGSGSHRVFFLADGNPLGSLEYVWDGRVINLRNNIEVMTVMAPLELFEKAVDAEELEIRIGTVETKLLPSEIAALKKLLDFVQDAPTNQPDNSAAKRHNDT